MIIVKWLVSYPVEGFTASGSYLPARVQLTVPCTELSLRQSRWIWGRCVGQGRRLLEVLIWSSYQRKKTLSIKCLTDRLSNWKHFEGDATSQPSSGPAQGVRPPQSQRRLPHAGPRCRPSCHLRPTPANTHTHTNTHMRHRLSKNVYLNVWASDRKIF